MLAAAGGGPSGCFAPSRSTTVRSASGLKGLRRNASAPASRAECSETSSPVRSTTGMSRVNGSAFIPWQKMSPLTPGMPTSRTTTSGCREAIF